MRIIENRGTEEPNQYDFRQNSGLRQLMVNIDVRIEESDIQDDSGEQYVWKTIIFAPGEHGYDTIVDALIRYKYPTDKMNAILNNYLEEFDLRTLMTSLSSMLNFINFRKTIQDWLSGKNQSIIDEYGAMQEYRAWAKRLAKEIIEELKVIKND